MPTGSSAELAERALGRADLDLVDMGGVGGTLAGNPLSVAAMRATLEHVLTEQAFDIDDRPRHGVRRRRAASDRHVFLPWSVTQLGARAEYRFASPAPRNGTESAASHDAALEDFLHLYLANRGILLTPFHNMALMCPQTTSADVERHHEIFEEAIRELTNRR